MGGCYHTCLGPGQARAKGFYGDAVHKRAIKLEGCPLIACMRHNTAVLIAEPQKLVLAIKAAFGIRGECALMVVLT